VQRNRAKRLLRAALQEVISDIPSGYEGILIARKPILDANAQETGLALKSLLEQAGLGPSKTYG
jgi:ribonuclease P protein component